MVIIRAKAWFLIWFLLFTSIAVMLLSIFFLRIDNLPSIIIGFLLVVVLDSLNIDLSKDTIITMSLPATYGLSLYHYQNVNILPWIIIPSILISDILRRTEWYKAVFNTSATFISAFLCSITFSYLLNLFPNPHTYTSMVVFLSALAGGLVYLISNTILLSSIISLSYNYAFKDVLINQILKRDQLAAVFLSFIISYTGLVLLQFSTYSLAIVIPFVYGIYLLFKRGRELELESQIAMEMAASTVDLRDPTYTSLHSKRVRDFAVAISKALDLPRSTTEVIESAALVHDIGKIGISDMVLKKPGKLDNEEWIEMKKHPVKGYELLKKLTKYKEEARLVLYHHERWEGKGYPAGLKWDKIPLGARILALADAIEAMLSDRPYRDRLTISQIIDELNNGAGTQFDPIIVNIAVELINKGIIS